MKLYDYITEVQIGKDKNIEDLFNLALKQVFDQNYLNRIENIIKKRITVKEKSVNDKAVAWVQGTTIFINKPVFYEKDVKAQIRYLLHEFMHILNNSKSFFILNDFKEIKELSKRLWKIIRKHSKDTGMFLTGKKVDSSRLNYQEALSYLMNDKINWNEISLDGRKLFIEELKKSGIFNLQHEFWKKRLN